MVRKRSGFRKKALNFAIVAVWDPWSGTQNFFVVPLLKSPEVTEMGKGNGKGRKHPEAAIRMNFLHQAAACVLKSTGNKVKFQ